MLHWCCLKDTVVISVKQVCHPTGLKHYYVPYIQPSSREAMKLQKKISYLLFCHNPLCFTLKCQRCYSLYSMRDSWITPWLRVEKKKINTAVNMQWRINPIKIQLHDRREKKCLTVQIPVIFVVCVHSVRWSAWLQTIKCAVRVSWVTVCSNNDDTGAQMKEAAHRRFRFEAK